MGSSKLPICPRFGTGAKVRDNVEVTFVYNESVLPAIERWKKDHHCTVEYANEERVRGRWHSFLRYMTCTGLPNAALVGDLAESVKQFVELQMGASGVNHEDVRKVMTQVRRHHAQGEHTLLVGHSQGNFMIAQAMQILPDSEQRPLNVGDGCTAVLTLASPIARSTFPVDPQYVRGMTVEGDILLQLHLPNDFERIHTPAGDSVATLDGLANRLDQGVEAHNVNKNYLENQESAAKVNARLTELSNECSGGLPTVSPSTLTMRVGDTRRLDVVLTSRTGGLLRGRNFTGRSLGAFVNGADSTVLATNITPDLNEIDVTLNNTQQVKAHLSVAVNRRPIKTDITYTAEPYLWTVITPAANGYYPDVEAYPCGEIVQGPPPTGVSSRRRAG